MGVLTAKDEAAIAGAAVDLGQRKVDQLLTSGALDGFPLISH